MRLGSASFDLFGLVLLFQDAESLTFSYTLDNLEPYTQEYFENLIDIYINLYIYIYMYILAARVENPERIAEGWSCKRIGDG